MGMLSKEEDFERWVKDYIRPAVATGEVEEFKITGWVDDGKAHSSESTGDGDDDDGENMDNGAGTSSSRKGKGKSKSKQKKKKRKSSGGKGEEQEAAALMDAILNKNKRKGNDPRRKEE